MPGFRSQSSPFRRNIRTKYATDQDAIEAVVALGKKVFGSFALVPVEKLIVPEYQRLEKADLIRMIVRGYDPTMFQPLMVGRRNFTGKDQYYVVDGQQRLAAARRLMLTHVPALIFDETTLQTEVDQFIALQELRVKLTTAEKIDAKLEGQDEEVLRMCQVMAKHRYAIFSPKGKYIAKHLETFRGSAEVAIKYFQDPDIFEETLSIMRECWGGEAFSLKTELLTGLFELLRKHGKELDKTVLRQRLKGLTPRDLFMRARALYYSTRCTSRRALSHLLLECYNRGRRRRIRSMFLMDDDGGAEAS